MAPAISSLPMPIHIVRASVSLDELRRIAAPQFGDFVKAVVDVSRGVMRAARGRGGAPSPGRSRFGGPLGHQPLSPPAGLGALEFDSMVEDAEVRRRILEIVSRLVVP